MIYHNTIFEIYTSSFVCKIHEKQSKLILQVKVWSSLITAISGTERDAYWSTQDAASLTNSRNHQQKSIFLEFQTFLYSNHKTIPPQVLHSILLSKGFSKHPLTATNIIHNISSITPTPKHVNTYA
jgi:hypothetical protein